MLKKIKNFFIKVFAFLFHLIFGKDEVVKEKRTIKDGKYVLNKNGKFVILPNDGEKGSFTMYPTVFLEEKKSLLNKIELVKEELIKSGKLEEKDLKELEELEKKVNSNLRVDLYTEIENKVDEIKTRKTNKDNIDEFNKEISDLLNRDKTDEDNRIIEQAYFKYKTVNYIITTTVKIDEIVEEIKELQEDLKLNKHSKYYYDGKCYELRSKIRLLKKINGKESVIKEINRLKDDFYTKSKDKYDLLYNEEVFVDLENSLNSISKEASTVKKEVKVEPKEEFKLSNKDIELLEKYLNMKKDEIKKLDKESLEKKISIAKREEEKFIKQDIEDRKKDIEDTKNIVKRFKDLKLAEMILLRQIYAKETNFSDMEDYYKDLLKAYQEFNNGIENNFNFDRNKKKTELAALINRIHYIDSRLTGEYYIPIQHINYEYSELIHNAIDWKDRIDTRMTKEGFKVEKEEESKGTDLKLKESLQKENDRKEKLGIKEKVLIKEEKND